MDLASAQLSIKESKFVPKTLDEDTLAYQGEIAKACGLALDKRILAFNAEPPMPKKEDLRTTWNRPLKAPNQRLAKRKILSAPEKVLDAPGMMYVSRLHS
jgi:cell division cycle protein 20 (cofactor of APC complex)